MIRLSFEGFSGSPRELAERVRRGQVAARDLPLLLLTEQAMAQVEALDLSERSALLPLLAELLLHKLRALAQGDDPVPVEEDLEAEAPVVLDTLVALEEAIAFLEQRSRERARVLPVAPPPLPKDRRVRSLSLELLVRAAEPLARRAELLLPPERFSLKEAWGRLLGFLRGGRRGFFHQLPFRGWSERVVAFLALLEAKRLGWVEMWQEENFGPIGVELLTEEVQLAELRQAT
ncbi:chromosome segregation protein ScpA [Meiothermus sp. QL-1]|uniref:chromosome segregation protein ScpA n=1 Tax=Meiothermus sp. QL-1 TaxID=2058095 RepID=UPI000E0B71AB|nr:chromosome segregation protein ScpA [Meiothermus sp. QL-1]RDI95547.1 chromosome segregation protein ScpA [Meiothermus sp. QL-1]